jgi:chemotaxis protein histidine kinase CheA
MNFELEASDYNEIFENIENIESSLLEFERQLAINNVDTTLIHVTFRYAHNLKSLLAMANKIECSKVIHIVESNFDLIRNGQQQINEKLIEKCLVLIDCIKSSFDTNYENLEVLEGLSLDLQHVFDATVENTEKNDSIFSEFPLTAKEEVALYQAIESKQNVFVIEKLISSNIEAEYFNNMPILDDIAEIGSCITVYPSHEKLNKDIEFSVVKLLITTEKSADDLEYVIFDTFRKIEFETPSKQEKTVRKKTTESNNTVLIFETDFQSRSTLIKELNEMVDVEVVVNKEEMLQAITMKSASKSNYHSIFLSADNVDSELLNQLVEFEKNAGLILTKSTNIIVSLPESKSNEAFGFYADYFITSPFEKSQMDLLKNYLYPINA